MNADQADQAAEHDLSDQSEQPGLSAVLEAVLLVTDEPVPAVTLAQVAEAPTEAVEAVLRELAQDYDH